MYLEEDPPKYAIIQVITPNFTNKFNQICDLPDIYGKIEAITPFLRVFL